MPEARAKPRKATPRAYHHGDLREALIDCGTTLIESSGVQALTLRAVAEAAGVSRQAPYHHFGSKEGLLTAIATRGFDRLAAAMEAEVRRERQLEDRLVGLGATYVRLALAAPRQFELCSGMHIKDVSRHAEFLAARERAFDVLRRSVGDYLNGRRPTGREVEIASAAAWAMAHGLARLLLEGGLRARKGDALVRAALATLVKGL